MKAVILAGGLGTRLSEETDTKPKPMLEIGGQPILWHIMKIYSSHGVNDFIICGGYKSYIIKEYFSNYSDQYDPAFVTAAFSEGVAENGENSVVIEISPEKFVVLALSSSEPGRQKELDEVEDQVESILRNIAAKKIIDDLSLTIETSLVSGDQLMTDKLLKDNELEWSVEGWISRSSELPFDVSSIAFSIPKPLEGEHSYRSRSFDGSTSLVIDLSAVRIPEDEADTGIAALYMSQENNEMFVSLIKQLRENADIKIFSDLL